MQMLSYDNRMCVVCVLCDSLLFAAQVFARHFWMLSYRWRCLQQ